MIKKACCVFTAGSFFLKIIIFPLMKKQRRIKIRVLKGPCGESNIRRKKNVF